MLDTPVVREFVAGVRETIAAAGSPEQACDAIRPRFAALLADADWLPARYQEGDPESGMGGGIGQWLLFRAPTAHCPCSRSSCRPARRRRSTTTSRGGSSASTAAPRTRRSTRARRRPRARRRAPAPGDFYALLPPRDDIHRVRTTSPETSVSLHLLTNDTGCVWRHAFDEHTGEASPFRSGYVNVDCATGSGA